MLIDPEDPGIVFLTNVCVYTMMIVFCLGFWWVVGFGFSKLFQLIFG